MFQDGTQQWQVIFIPLLVQQMLIKLFFCPFLLGIDSTKLKDTLPFFFFFPGRSLPPNWILRQEPRPVLVVFGKFNNRERRVTPEDISLERTVICKHGFRS